jgi:hypothetical protein
VYAVAFREFVDHAAPTQPTKFRAVAGMRNEPQQTPMSMPGNCWRWLVGRDKVLPCLYAALFLWEASDTRNILTFCQYKVENR